MIAERLSDALGHNIEFCFNDNVASLRDNFLKSRNEFDNKGWYTFHQKYILGIEMPIQSIKNTDLAKARINKSVAAVKEHINMDIKDMFCYVSFDTFDDYAREGHPVYVFNIIKATCHKPT